MTNIINILEGFPEELRGNLLKFYQATREELLNAATKEDIAELRSSIKELTEAQKRSEGRLDKVEKSILELVEAQKRTDKEISSLTHEMKNMKKELGGLSHSVGFNLEDEAYKKLPSLLKKDLKVTVVGKLKREFIIDDKGSEIELNIIGNAKRNNKTFTILGEAKANLSVKHIDRFLRQVKNLQSVIKGELILVMVTYMTHPKIVKYAKEHNVSIYFSYDF